MKTKKEKIIDDFNGYGEMLEIPCSKFYTNKESIHVCKYSGLVRVKHIRSAKEIANDWSKKVYGNKFDSYTYTAHIPAVKARHTYLADYANLNIDLKNKFICDIGAGEGQFLNIIRNNYQANIYGIEPSEKNCKFLKKNGINCFNGTIEDYINYSDPKKIKFDVITLMWTLVNSASCLEMIKAAYHMLKPGGYLVIGESSRILVPFKKPLTYYFSKLPVDLHPYHFSANSLSNLVKLAGFKITNINRYFDTDYLCLIAQKLDSPIEGEYEIDDFNQVLSFFERWHIETKEFYKHF